MKTLTIILAVLILSGCAHKMDKPFIIIQKHSDHYENGIAVYYYQDKNGNQKRFTDFNNKYSIGDTIK